MADSACNVSDTMFEAFQTVPATALLKTLPTQSHAALMANLAELVIEFLQQHEGDDDMVREGNLNEDLEECISDHENCRSDWEESEPGELLNRPEKYPVGFWPDDVYRDGEC